MRSGFSRTEARAPSYRTAELATIGHFLQGHGAQRCPPRFASAVARALPREQEAARIAAVRVQKAMPLRLLIDALYRSFGPMKP
jgi:hypothetical protein